MQESMYRITNAILDSYQEIGGINHIGGPNLPSRRSITNILIDLESLIFPGYREDEELDEGNIKFTIAEKISRVSRNLATEIEKSLQFRLRSAGSNAKVCRERAEWETFLLLEDIPEIRRRVKVDVEAAFDGDPAAKSHEEVILAYPGVEAIIAHRIAHFLNDRDIPLIPRMISEYIHGKTGIDIHPGAQIGEYFFIDHATGVVIGETTIIGDRVKIYQGVTIGALSVKKEMANEKRHPTIEDDVTIYAGATILGGDTVIGRGSTIGGNVWITESVPPGSRIYNKPSEYVRK
jgi:serine O-acetyltransferase